MVYNPFYNIELAGPQREAGDMRSYGFGPERSFIPSTVQNAPALSFSQPPGTLAGGNQESPDIWETLLAGLGTFGTLALLDSLLGGSGSSGGTGSLLNSIFGGGNRNSTGTNAANTASDLGLFQSIFGDWDNNPSTGLLTGGLNELLGTSADTALGSVWQSIFGGPSVSTGGGTALGGVGAAEGSPAFLGGEASLGAGASTGTGAATAAGADPLGIATTGLGAAAMMAVPAAFLVGGILESFLTDEDPPTPGYTGGTFTDFGQVNDSGGEYSTAGTQQAFDYLNQLMAQNPQLLQQWAKYSPIETDAPINMFEFTYAPPGQGLPGGYSYGIYGQPMPQDQLASWATPQEAATALYQQLLSGPVPVSEQQILNPYAPRYFEDTGHAEGGRIAGPGGPKDDVIPAYLSDGEYVFPAEAVNRMGGGDNDLGAEILDEFLSRLTGQRPP